MDEVIKSDLFFEGDTLVHKQTQPSENLILERNSELRKNGSAINDFGKGTQTWGRMVASIPIIMFDKAVRDGYDLYSKEPGRANKEMLRFLQSPDGKICMIRDKL